jgi:hypothetical protein
MQNITNEKNVVNACMRVCNIHIMLYNVLLSTTKKKVFFFFLNFFFCYMRLEA